MLYAYLSNYPVMYDLTKVWHILRDKFCISDFDDNVGQIDMISFEETLDSHRFESKLSFYNEIPTDPEYVSQKYM